MAGQAWFPGQRVVWEVPGGKRSRILGTVVDVYPGSECLTVDFPSGARAVSFVTAALVLHPVDGEQLSLFEGVSS